MPLLRMVDRMYLVFQTAAKSFGFLGAAEAGIATAHVGGRRVVRFGEPGVRERRDHNPAAA